MIYQGPRTKDLLPVCGREEDHGTLLLVRTVVGAVDDLVTPGVKTTKNERQEEISSQHFSLM